MQTVWFLLNFVRGHVSPFTLLGHDNFNYAADLAEFLA